MSLIITAARLANELHEYQTRKYSGRPYIEHPCRVASKYMLRNDSNEVGVAACYLHDVIEDCGISSDQLYHKLKLTRDISNLEYTDNNIANVCFLVNELTNAPRDPTLNRAERKRLDRERLRTVCSTAKIIKLIDRIDNLTELKLDYDRGLVEGGFVRKYCEESRLLNAVIGEDSKLSTELDKLINSIIDRL